MKEIKINGMVCVGCENRVKNALVTIEGVEEVEADYKTGRVTIKENKAVDMAKIEEKIEDLGFEMKKD